MKAYVIQEGSSYCPDDKNIWSQTDIVPVEAIKIYGGKRTLMLIWEVDECMHSIVIPSHEDSVSIAERTGTIILEKIKKQFLK